MKMSRLMCGFFSLWVASAIASGGKEFAEGINYIPITPALIVNYGGPSPKVRYIKAELSIRTESAVDAQEIVHHLPIIRDRLISIFSTQTEESLSSAEGKEKLRLLALDEINAAVHLAEHGNHTADEAKHGEEKADKKDSKSDKKKDKKKSDKNSKDGDKKKGDDEKEDKEKSAPEPKKGPASDLFFNNFVVQK